MDVPIPLQMVFKKKKELDAKTLRDSFSMFQYIFL